MATRLPELLSKVSPSATSACPFDSNVIVSKARDSFRLLILFHVRVEGLKSVANPFVSLIGCLGYCCGTSVMPPATRTIPVLSVAAALSQPCRVVVHGG